MNDVGIVITIALAALGLYFVYRQMHKTDLEDTGYKGPGGGRYVDRPDQDHK